MAKYTFEEAKDAIAKKYGHDDWHWMIVELMRINEPGTADLIKKRYAEAAEFLANEAVKEDRKELSEILDYTNCLPLPYPEVKIKTTEK